MISKNFLFFEVNHGLSPLYLSNILPSHVGDVSSCRLRNAENYVGIYANTHAHAESFLPSTLQAWNNLSEAVRSADTLASFNPFTALPQAVLVMKTASFTPVPRAQLVLTRCCLYACC